jgi:hypothetical protein
MNAVEGPLWVAVRGKGLAYGTNFAYNIDTSFVNFDVYRSPNAHKAFEASKQIVEDHLSGASPFDPLMLEGAISSIVVGYANEQMTAVSAAQGSFIRQVVRNLPSDYKEKMLKRVRDISVDEVKGALREIILPLFSSKTANLVITCGTVLEEVCLPMFSFTLHAQKPVLIPANRPSSKASSLSASPRLSNLSRSSRTTMASSSAMKRRRTRKKMTKTKTMKMTSPVRKRRTVTKMMSKRAP